ncbi:uncharacterized protein [Lolium perenne]|uniref:uncharacterized protein n=1 Tax=Lolium perenne TaxID=4522 RepID=UPI003A998108
MGENQGLEKTLEKLAELLTAKVGGVLSSHSTVSEQTQKIELPSNEIKLEGVKNYLSWSRRALLILRTKDLESYVEGEAAEPGDKTSPKWKVLSTTNSLIVAWLLNSLSPTIAASVEILSSAAEVWKTLKKLYSGEGNVMLMAETEERLSELRQEDKSVMEYVTELQHLWADLDHYDPLELHHADCIAAARKWIERRRVMKFLKGLNSEFEGRRAALYHQPSLPTLEDAIAAIAQEEVRLKLTKSNTTTPSRPGFVVTQSLETRDCFNCGENGHLSRNCTAPCRGIRGRGRGYNRDGLSRGRGRGRGYSSGPRANVAFSEEESSGKSSGTSHEELKKEANVTNDGGYGDFSFDKFAHLAYTDEDVWTCPVISISGMKYFVTFIDCYSRMTWVYLMKHKNEVQVIRTDNGTEYVNKEFGAFLSAEGEASREGESEVLRTNEDEPLRVMVDSVPYPMGEEKWRKPNEEENLKVYTRRKSQHEQQQQQAPTTSDTQVQGEQHAPTGVETDELSDDAGPSITRDSMDLPIALRKGTRAAARKPLNWYQEEHDIANYVSYTSLSTNYRAFIASLQSMVIPRDWKVAKQDPKWREAMIEELNALERNKTWELVHLPAGKRAVGCKWIYTVKQNPEGKIERYKARLVARGYSQTYGIDYDETFAPVAKMNTVRILISCATNFGWPLHQLDVKNAFLHGDLKEEVYMDIPPGFSTPRTSGKVCRLRKSLYGLKQSPRAWFDIFRRVICAMRYKQCNGDHTVFYRHSNSKITILAVYVDDIIITGDDEVEISRLKDSLRKEFEVKDLGQLKYFLGIEIARSPKGIVLSQRKYVLDLLSDIGMLGCRVASTPIDQNHKLCAESGEPVNKEKYQKLVGRLIYLCHTRPDISYAVSVVSRYMHDPRSGHLDAVNQILRYLKGSPGKGLWFKRNGHLNVDGYCDADWASCLDDRRSTSGYCVFVGGNLVSWRSKKQPVVSKSTAEAEYRAMSQGLSEMLWVRNLFSEPETVEERPFKFVV